MISPIFTTIVISFLLIMAYMKITTNRFSTGDEECLEQERKSNSVRKKSLDDLDYITIPFGSLPFAYIDPNNIHNDPGNSAPSGDNTAANDGSDDSAIRKDETDILALKDKKIVNFTGISNTDLKFTYGAPNLPILTEYDQNFTELVRALDSWGTHLNEHGKGADARKVLEFAVECRTDLKSSYVQLADMYAENFEFDKLDHLIEVAEGLNSLMKGPIVRALKERCNINKYVERK